MSEWMGSTSGGSRSGTKPLNELINISNEKLHVQLQFERLVEHVDLFIEQLQAEQEFKGKLMTNQKKVQSI